MPPSTCKLPSPFQSSLCVVEHQVFISRGDAILVLLGITRRNVIPRLYRTNPFIPSGRYISTPISRLRTNSRWGHTEIPEKQPSIFSRHLCFGARGGNGAFSFQEKKIHPRFFFSKMPGRKHRDSNFISASVPRRFIEVFFPTLECSLKGCQASTVYLMLAAL